MSIGCNDKANFPAGNARLKKKKGHPVAVGTCMGPKSMKESLLFFLVPPSTRCAQGRKPASSSSSKARRSEQEECEEGGVGAAAAAKRGGGGRGGHPPPPQQAVLDLHVLQLPPHKTHSSHVLQSLERRKCARPRCFAHSSFFLPTDMHACDVASCWSRACTCACTHVHACIMCVCSHV